MTDVHNKATRSYHMSRIRSKKPLPLHYKTRISAFSHFHISTFPHFLMSDVHTPATRSYNMSRIRSKDIKPEMLVR
ncbi:MAG TPA: hypothetical protein P5228_01165 [Bacteroidales bacterium]|nr:hypothetical protein [Bacteroidales bacterium]HRZ49161.1 hypothetical protein [Bacteroidales bacterium]